jgi:ABC-2 type transport system ATP-binding protein
MKDIAALCRRVVVITDGAIKFDGSLAQIRDDFSGSKILHLQLAVGQSAEGLERFAQVVSVVLPKVNLRCPRADVTKMLANILQQYQVDDISVEDPPLEEVIAALFAKSAAK